MKRRNTSMGVLVLAVALLGVLPSPAVAGGPETAQRIFICHGPTDGSGCAQTEPVNEPGDEHEIHILVVDQNGQPVSGVAVQFRETGPGIFVPQGGSTINVVTDANGFATAVLTSDVEGTSTIVAEITQAGAACSGSASGCVSQTLTKIWDEIFQCEDGLDNDGDGAVDTQDGGCTAGTDPYERIDATHDRRISIRFQDGTGARNNGLVVFGRLTTPDAFGDCTSRQPVNVQRRVNGRWVTKKSTVTNRRGRYAVEIFDLAGRYRAGAPPRELEDADADTLDICPAASATRRR